MRAHSGGLSPDFPCQKRLPEKGASKQRFILRDVLVCALVHGVHVYARWCLGDRLRWYPGTSWQAESVVHVRVGSERRRVGFQTLRNISHSWRCEGGIRVTGSLDSAAFVRQCPGRRLKAQTPCQTGRAFSPEKFFPKKKLRVLAFFLLLGFSSKGLENLDCA